MKIFTAQQLKEFDQFTILNEPISSIDLMERAALELCKVITSLYTKETQFSIVCGRGNNGGDGLAMARILYIQGYKIELYIIQASKPLSPESQYNLDRLPNTLKPKFIDQGDELEINNHSIIIDCIFGTGLSSLPSGNYAEFIHKINRLNQFVISIDLPSGLSSDFPRATVEREQDPPIIKANLTLTIQQAKLSFFFKESEDFVGDWKVVEIGLSRSFVERTDSEYHHIDVSLIKSIYRKRKRFSHKGNYGHSLIIAGSEGMLGAALLATKSCLKAGSGLVSCAVNPQHQHIFHSSVPEAILVDMSNALDATKYTSVGIGPGMGAASDSIEIVKRAIHLSIPNMVMDADALNCLALTPELLRQLPKNAILTPHPKEFDRLFGPSESSFERFKKQINNAKRYQVIIILKGAYTSIALPNGTAYINSTGNPGMATAGSGDVLTGVLTALLAQNYTPEQAAILGVYLHGLAADLSLEIESQESLIASDIILNLGKAYKQMG